MIDYLLIVVACMLIALQFTANKVYQRNATQSKGDMMLYPMVTGIFSLVIFVILGLITGDFLSGFFASVKTLTFWLGLLNATLGALSIVFGVLTAKHGSTAVYSVFMMLGSMIIATLFGITVWSEPANVLKIVGIVLLMISIVIPVIGKGEKMNLTFTILCVIAGTINGFYTVVSIWHSKLIGTDSVTNVNSFMNWQYLFMAIICLVTYVVMKFIIKVDKKGESISPSVCDNTMAVESKKPFYKKLIVILILSAGLYSLSSGFGYLAQLIVLENLPATVVTPCVSGLAIVFSAVAGYVFFKEKTGIKDLISIAITIVGVALIIIDALVVI